MQKFYLLIISVSICFSSFSQQLTSTFGGSPFKLDWQHAGYPGDTIPSYAIIKDITAFGADNTGAVSVNTAYTNAVNSLAGSNGVIYFPPGNYLFTAGLRLRSGLILRGAGSGATTLTFNLPVEGDLIRVVGSAGASTPVTAAVQQYGNQVTVADAGIASMGSFVKVYQNNESNLINDSWADNTVGQISYVKSKQGNAFTFYTRHRRAIPLSGAPTAQVLNMVTGVGIECLKIKRMDVDLVINQTSNINFTYAAFCWVKGIDSDSTNFAHINISNSTNIEVTGSYFHGAFSYGSGGVAYGVVCHISSGDCLIENNIFRNLRHAMLLQAGSNGNIYAYNYSLQQKRTEFPSDAALDIVLHGNYPYANLFEGNISQNIGGDASHGINGPANVFFRNRAQHMGIVFSPGSGDSSIVMYNEITGTGSSGILPLGGLTTVGANTIASRNYRQSTGGFVGNMESRFAPTESATYTHFLEAERPYFFNTDLPQIGYPGIYNNPLVSIPARDRFIAGATMTYCSNRSRKDSMMPVRCNPLSVASHGGYDVHDIAETNEYRDNSNCGRIAAIVPSGPTPVKGIIKTSITVDASVQQFAGKPYVQRHYNIEPISNAGLSTARLTLFFTQQEFNNYNAANGTEPDLPESPIDMDGKANVQITQHHGTGTAPGNYTGNTEVIDPDDSNIVWNATTNLWEISFNVTGFSGFFLSGVSAPLPVKLVSFHYYLQEKQKVLLKWEVAEQLDIRRYVVERSADGRIYTAIGSLAANNESSFTYQYTDSDPLNGVSYYRLRIVEDNVVNFSHILVVNISENSEAITIYPVPAGTQVTIRLRATDLLHTEAQLINAEGRLLQKIKLSGLYQILQTGHLPTGMYYLKTINGKVYKIIKR